MKENSKKAGFVQKEFQRRSRERQKFELQWQLNMNFFSGNQYCEILPEAGRIYSSDKQYPWQEREVYNHIAPIVESRLAKLNKVLPQVSVRPATDDEEDVESAKVSTLVLRSAFERNSMDAVIKEATVWSELCGTVFYKQGWVSAKGTVVGIDENGRNIREGDIFSSVCPPYEIYPDTSAVQDISGCNSVIHAKVYSCDYIKELWHKEVKPQSVRTLGVNEFFYKSENEESDRALLLEYYEQPSERYPKGRLLVVCGEELLFEGDLPYINGEGNTRKLPFVQQNAVTRPGCIWGVSVVERCIPVQRAYNAVRNRMHELLSRSAVGVLTVEEGTADVDDLVENGLRPGKVIVYRQGAGKPEMMYPGNIPSEFAREEAALLEEFNLISGTSDLMRQSVAPTNVTSGTALNTIAEQDDTRLAVTADRIRDAVLEISRQWLRLFKQFAGQMRLERVLGANGKIAKMYWSASMLTADDVIHETENELSDSLANRRQLIYELMSRGLFLDENGRMSQRVKGRLLRALGMGDWENISDISEIHVARAQRENLRLKSGEEVRVLDSDDHDIHISEHAKVFLSEEFEENAAFGTDTFARFEEHIRQHREKLKEENYGDKRIGRETQDA